MSSEYVTAPYCLKKRTKLKSRTHKISYPTSKSLPKLDNFNILSKFLYNWCKMEVVLNCQI